MSLQAINRIIPSNPSDISFERDFRANTENLLSGVKTLDNTVTEAVTALVGVDNPEGTLADGVNSLKTVGESNKDQIAVALEAINLTDLPADFSWQYGVDSTDTASNLRFATLHSRFTYLDSRCDTIKSELDSIYDEANGEYSTIHERFEAVEADATGVIAEVDAAHRTGSDNLNSRFSDIDTLLSNAYQNDITNAISSSFASIEARFSEAEGRATALESEVNATHRDVSDNLASRFSDVEGRATTIEGELNDARDPSVSNDTLHLRFSRLEEFDDELLSDNLSKSVGSSATVGEAFFVSIQSDPNGVYRFVLDVPGHSFSDDDIVFFRNSLTSTNNTETDSLLNQQYTLERVNSSSRFLFLKDGNDNYVVASSLGWDATAIPTKLTSSSGDASFTSVFTGSTYQSLKWSINDHSINTPSYELINKFSTASNRFFSIENRATDLEARATSIEQEINAAHTDTESTLDQRFDGIDGLIVNAYTQINGQTSNVFTTIEERFDAAEGRLSTSENIGSEAYTELTETGKSYSSIQDRFSQDETRIADLETEVDAAHRTGSDTLSQRFTDLDTQYSKDANGVNLDLGYTTIDERLVSAEGRITTNEGDISSIETTLASNATQYAEDAGSHSTIHERFGDFALKNGNSTENFSASNISAHNGVNLNSTKITNLMTPSSDMDGANKYYVDNQLASRDLEITELQNRPEVPVFLQNGTDEGKVLQISGNAATWQTPAQVDTSTAYSWIPDVAFQTIQFDGEVLADRSLDAGFIYYVAGNLTIDANATIYLQGSDDIEGARLIVQGHVIGDLNNIEIVQEFQNKGSLEIQNWNQVKTNYKVKESISTSNLNLFGDQEFEGSLELYEGTTFTIDTNVDLIFKELIYTFVVNGVEQSYASESDIPAELIGNIGQIDLQAVVDGITMNNSIDYINQNQRIKEIETSVADSIYLASKFSITETATERVFEFLGT